MTGTLFAGIAALLVAIEERQIANWMLFASSACAAVGAICVIAGTVSLMAATVTVACTAGALVVAWLGRTKREKRLDMEAFPRRAA